MNQTEQGASSAEERNALSESKRLGLIKERAARGYYNSDKVTEEVVEAILEWYGIRRGGKPRWTETC